MVATKKQPAPNNVISLPPSLGPSNPAPVYIPQLPIHADTLEDYLARFAEVYPGQSPWCSNIKCDCLRVLTRTGKLSKYCPNPQCAKTKHYLEHRSSEVLKKLAAEKAQADQAAMFYKGYAQGSIEAASLAQATNAAAVTDQLAALKAQLDELPKYIQPRLPLSDVGQSTRAAPTSKPSDDGIQVTQPAKKAGNAARILTLQVRLASSQKNIDTFTLADLELVTGHPAFNQALIQAEIKRRMAAPTAPVTPSPTPTTNGPRPIQGSEAELPPPNFDDLDLL